MRSSKRLMPGQVSLERALSKLGIASRTQARAWIVEGRVRVNGIERRDPGFAVVPERARIEVDGEQKAKAEHRYFLLHKPRGVVTTRSDEKGRATVFSLLPPGLPPLHSVGRLDFATTGLLILTNDTRLSNWLTDPSSAVPRTYLVSVRGEVSEAALEKLRAGISDEGEKLRAEDVVLRKASGRESHLVVTLTEGKNREIRRMFDSLGHDVMKLKRVAYGMLELGELQPGESRELSRKEIEAAFPKWGARDV